jgi:hypothetical protein
MAAYIVFRVMDGKAGWLGLRKRRKTEGKLPLPEREFLTFRLDRLKLPLFSGCLIR